MVKSRRKAAFCSVNPPIPGISRTCSHCECQDVKLGFTSQGGASASPKVWTSFHIFSGMGCRMLPFMKEQGHHCSMFISPFRSEGMDPSLSIFSQFLTLISTDFVFFTSPYLLGFYCGNRHGNSPRPRGAKLEPRAIKGFTGTQILGQVLKWCQHEGQLINKKYLYNI